MRHRILDTFTGPFTIVENDDLSLSTMWLTSAMRRRLEASRLAPRMLPDLARRLKAYFAGDERVAFDDVPTPSSGGEFFRTCWEACRGIPRGTTITYGGLASRAGEPTASRAAGQAMRKNPLPIIVPCHRVIAASGRLHGFAGSCDSGGSELSIKRALLEMEGWPSAPTRNREGLLEFPRRGSSLQLAVTK